jgi:hypothetical protein
LKEPAEKFVADDVTILEKDGICHSGIFFPSERNFFDIPEDSPNYYENIHFKFFLEMQREFDTKVAASLGK